ncbi:sugar transferase [Gordonibacter massiliensis (ex Traore et al. 2017)]|uniref:sugar transferase n=1 Tax=Gordonibacter massiliensis (ex Traore et al. 2017) TaxID=1841863 RepID=UPI001FE4536C|nr:sugar transferase [Gordonibacter massiliensis (ex Traore et al. 2017)]
MQSHRPTGGGGADRCGRYFMQEMEPTDELAVDEGALPCEVAAEPLACGGEVDGAHAKGRMGYRIAKRAFDIVFSATAIALLLVPSIILCIAIRLESPGSPIYSQKRVGRIGADGKVVTFDMYKFRSMYADADERLPELQEMNEADGPLFKIKNDPRVTRIGRFIRKHSIDELPQFVNCFLGQLSTVGPRPPLPNEVSQYDEHAMRRLSVKPGLTGYWQTSGRSDTSFDDMVDLDLKYIQECGALTDFKVIARTVAVVFNGKGAC